MTYNTCTEAQTTEIYIWTDNNYIWKINTV